MANLKRWLWIGIGAVVGVPALLCGGSGIAGLLLDPAIELSIEEELSASPQALFDLLDDAEGLERWWGVAMDAYEAEHGEGTRMQIVAQPGPERGVGTKVDFVAGGMTAETWEILAVTAPERVVYDVDFKIMRVERTIELEPSGTGTKVRWSETGRIGNPWVRLMAKASGGEEGAKNNFRMALTALEQAATP